MNRLPLRVLWHGQSSSPLPNQSYNTYKRPLLSLGSGSGFALFAQIFMFFFRPRFCYNLQTYLIYLFSFWQSSTMQTSGFGRQFHAKEHLAQHRADNRKQGISWQRKNLGLPHAAKVDKTSQDTSIWNGICRRQVVGTISASELDSPSSAEKVTSSQGCDLICNYNLEIRGEFWFPG